MSKWTKRQDARTMQIRKPNGRSAAIVEFVAANPGSHAKAIRAAIGCTAHNGLITYCVNTGKLWPSGRKRDTRYYATRELAQANDARHRAEFDRASMERAAQAERAATLRKRARRHASGARPVNTRPGACTPLEPEATLSESVKYTRALAPPGRFDADPTQSPMIFRGLGIGAYEDTGSAISRAYATKTSGKQPEAA